MSNEDIIRILDESKEKTEKSKSEFFKAIERMKTAQEKLMKGL